MNLISQLLTNAVIVKKFGSLLFDVCFCKKLEPNTVGEAEHLGPLLKHFFSILTVTICGT